MSDIHELINKTNDAIENVTELIYQQKLSEAMDNMSTFLNNVTELADNMSAIEGISDEDKTKLVDTLKEAVSAMEYKDYVLLADILKYDMTELIEGYSKAVGE